MRTTALGRPLVRTFVPRIYADLLPTRYGTGWRCPTAALEGLGPTWPWQKDGAPAMYADVLLAGRRQSGLCTYVCVTFDSSVPPRHPVR